MARVSVGVAQPIPSPYLCHKSAGLAEIQEKGREYILLRVTNGAGVRLCLPRRGSTGGRPRYWWRFFLLLVI